MLAATPSDRVAAFQHDVVAAYREAEPLFESDHEDSFERWEALTAQLDARHCVPGVSLDLGGELL